MRIEIVNPADWIPKVSDLLAANWAETGFDFPFAPDVQAYRKMHALGLMFGVGAFDAGSVIGYCTVCVTPHPHNPAVVVASNDALYVEPSRRCGTTAPRIMAAAEDEAIRRGAHRFTWHCRAGTPLARAMERRGYEPVDIVVMKRLSNGN